MCKERMIPISLIRLPEMPPAQPSSVAAATASFDDRIPLLTEVVSAANGSLLQQQFIDLVRQLEPTLNETQLAEQLGISRKTLWERRKTLGIPRVIRRRSS